MKAVDHLHDPFHDPALLHRFLQTALENWDDSVLGRDGRIFALTGT